MHVGRSSGHITHTPTVTVRQTTPILLTINTLVHTHTQRLRLVLQFSEVKMKFLLVHFIVVPLIIFTVPSLKGVTADGAPSANDCGNVTLGWRNVAYIDPHFSKSNCSEWKLMYKEINGVLSAKFCIRSQKLPVINDCSTIKVPTQGIPYTKVCGQAEGYQLGFTRAFHSNKYAKKSLNSSYVSGLSVTRGQGNDLEHIWTFAAGFSQDYGYATVNCPCAYYPDPNPPSFMNEKTHTHTLTHTHIHVHTRTHTYIHTQSQISSKQVHCVAMCLTAMETHQ